MGNVLKGVAVERRGEQRRDEARRRRETRRETGTRKCPREESEKESVERERERGAREERERHVHTWVRRGGVRLLYRGTERKQESRVTSCHSAVGTTVYSTNCSNCTRLNEYNLWYSNLQIKSRYSVILQSFSHIRQKFAFAFACCIISLSLPIKLMKS